MEVKSKKSKRKKVFKRYTMKFTRNELTVIRIGMKLIQEYSENKHCLIPAKYIYSKIEMKLHYKN